MRDRLTMEWRVCGLRKQTRRTAGADDAAGSKTVACCQCYLVPMKIPCFNVRVLQSKQVAQIRPPTLVELVSHPGARLVIGEIFLESPAELLRHIHRGTRSQINVGE